VAAVALLEGGYTKTDTRQFVDPSIAAAALGASPPDLLNDLKTFGLLFESLCVRDLRIYFERLNGVVYNYRDSLGLEADAIVHLNNGTWGAVEVKLGTDEAIERGAGKLRRLQEKIDIDKMSKLAFLMVIMATGFAHRRADG
jgi:hypothetical protein